MVDYGMFFVLKYVEVNGGIKMEKEQLIIDFVKDKKKFKKKLLKEFVQMICTGVRYINTGDEVIKEDVSLERVAKLIDNIDEVVRIVMIAKIRDYGIRIGFTNEEGGYYAENYEKRINELVGKEIVPVRDIARDYAYLERQIELAMETNLLTEREGMLRLLKVQKKRDLELCEVGKLDDQFDAKYIVKLASDVKSEYREKKRQLKEQEERMVFKVKNYAKKK